MDLKCSQYFPTNKDTFCIYVSSRWKKFNIYVICVCCVYGVQHVLSNEQHDGCLIRGRNRLPFASTWVHPRFFCVVHVVHLFYFSGLCFFSLLLFCFSSSCVCVPNVASFSRLSILDWPSIFSNVYIFKISPLSKKYCFITTLKGILSTTIVIFSYQKLLSFSVLTFIKWRLNTELLTNTLRNVVFRYKKSWPSLLEAN